MKLEKLINVILIFSGKYHSSRLILYRLMMRSATG